RTPPSSWSCSTAATKRRSRALSANTVSIGFEPRRSAKRSMESTHERPDDHLLLPRRHRTRAEIRMAPWILCDQRKRSRALSMDDQARVPGRRQGSGCACGVRGDFRRGYAEDRQIGGVVTPIRNLEWEARE